MKKAFTYIAIIIPVGLILYILLGDFFGNSLKKSDENPFALEVDEFKDVDPSLIHYRESKRINLNIDAPQAIAYQNGILGLIYANHIQIIDTTGIELVSKQHSGPLTAIFISKSDTIYVGCKDHIELFDMAGNQLQVWDKLDQKALITSIISRNDVLFAADAGNRVVLKYSKEGELLHSFEGRGRMEGNHGFIIPSPYFDLDIDPENQLWVTNPGMLYLENYSDEGTLRAFWGEASFDIEGFTGCCNPAHFTLLQDGSFVTSEKGLVRIKVYKPSGELASVVAGPKSFNDDSEPPDVAVDNSGRIFALDISRKVIRIFEKKTS